MKSKMDPDEIRELRESLAMTQDEFAELVGVSGGRTIRKWENGERLPSGLALAMLNKIMDTAETEIIPHQPGG